MSVPAFLVSMNALRISEQQRVDAQQARTASDRAGRRDFALRVTVEPGEVDIADPLMTGGTITVKNGNALPTTVQIHVELSDNNVVQGPAHYATFDAPACSQVVYRMRHDEERTRTFDDADGRTTLVVVVNPLDPHSRFWSPGLGAEPVTTSEVTRLSTADSLSVSDFSSTSRYLPTCM
ncbi:hypothetical protein ACFFV7_53055 [Nonomuraea spiralis]|uniref:Uncharacterized protein n=1 Tax=Nonomuraea spiralis TaxID=46182 RepID=A0ABV5J1X2_9ACTN|nr:hypothetical protein [Nonomuraea spiralis]GGT19332.1 hypothetical protein GCM10010176_074780 [Nonomuraea spiralis]